MPAELRIGVLDSGYGPAQAPQVLAARRFVLSATDLDEAPAVADPLGHGSAVCQAILQRAPQAQLYVAQVFDERGLSSPLQIAAALYWLAEQGVRLINLSLGIPQDRPLVRQAVAAVQESGALLCASTPARGAQVYPASYPGVLRVTGDARCRPEQWSWLNNAQADFGAAVQIGGAAGSSIGCATFCGHLAARLIAEPELCNAALLEALRQGATYRGAERKLAERGADD